MVRHFLSLADIDRREFLHLLDLGRRLKAGEAVGGPSPLAGKTLLLVFNKPSTRTRISFQVAMYQLGGLAIDLRTQESQINRGETIADTARVLSRYADAVVVRTFGQEEVVEWAAHAAIPVINGLTDRFHPCQLLADFLTVAEHRGSAEGFRVAYLGDGNNMLHSWVMAATLLDFELVMSTPEGYDIEPSVMEEARRRGFRGPEPRLVRDPHQAVSGADVIYTDVWTSMGQEDEARRRLEAFRDYQVNEALLSQAAPGAAVMHCLPAHRGEEITDGVVEGPQSILFQQAENRLHMQKALLLFLLAGTAGQTPAYPAQSP